MTASASSRFNVNIFGEGSQPILFSHGLGCSQVMWRYIYPAFEKQYKVVLLDLMGCGNSDTTSYNEERYSSLHAYADDLIEVATELGLKEIIFVGHSVSSMIGMLASIKAPELFAEIIMIGPSPYYANEKDYKGGFEKYEINEVLRMMDVNMNEWAEMFCPKFLGRGTANELGEELRKSFCSIDPKIVFKFAHVTFHSDLRDELSSLTTPTLILQGTNDIIVPVEVGEFMEKKIPNCTLKLIPAVGHYAHLTDPDIVKSSISEYLNNK